MLHLAHVNAYSLRELMIHWCAIKKNRQGTHLAEMYIQQIHAQQLNHGNRAENHAENRAENRAESLPKNSPT